MTTPKFVAIIATHNAAEHLENCLNSLQGCNSIVVFDQKSTDNTAEIVHRHKHSLVAYDKTFAEEPETVIRNRMTKFADHYYKGYHIIRLDADEILSDDWHKTLVDIIRTYNPDYIKVPYYQLVGDARYMQFINPVDHRTTVFAPLKGPYFKEDPVIRYHSNTPIIDENKLHHTLAINLIHLGYIGDLRRRYYMNCLRGDWSDRADVQQDTLKRIDKDPFSFTFTVKPMAQDLLASSKILQEITKVHAATRTVELTPHGDGQWKIKHITYHADDRKP